MVRFVWELMRRVQFLTRRRRMVEELREEMNAHLAMLADETDPISAK